MLRLAVVRPESVYFLLPEKDHPDGRSHTVSVLMVDDTSISTRCHLSVSFPQEVRIFRHKTWLSCRHEFPGAVFADPNMPNIIDCLVNPPKRKGT